MAFFGLTALGLQNPVALSSDTIIHFPIFTDEDFRREFDTQKRKFSPDGLCITRKQIPALMEDVYRGQVPNSEIQLLLKWVDKVSRHGDNIYWHELQDAIRAAREEAEYVMRQTERELGPACESQSWKEYSEKTRKCSAAKRAPPEKYICPLTAQQEIGWEAPVFGPRRAKTSSEETRFASEMIRSGVY